MKEKFLKSNLKYLFVDVLAVLALTFIPPFKVSPLAYVFVLTLSIIVFIVYKKPPKGILMAFLYALFVVILPVTLFFYVIIVLFTFEKSMLDLSFFVILGLSLIFMFLFSKKQKGENEWDTKKYFLSLLCLLSIF